MILVNSVARSTFVSSSLAVFERSGQSISRLAISGLTRHPGVPTDAIGLQGPSRRSFVRALLRSIPDGVARGLDLLFQEIAESIFARIPGLEYIFRYFAHRVPWRSANRQFLPACPGYSQRACSRLIPVAGLRLQRSSR